MRIHEITGEPVTDISTKTIKQQKQGLIFVNTRRSAEKAAEDLADTAKKEKLYNPHPELRDRILNVLSTPTKQCKRLAKCVMQRVAFHHAGLHSKQRTLIEEAFKTGKIHIIASTPTLAAGLDMPAYRVIIRDTKRYTGGWGMQPIPVLEYHQMAGRAGRPSYDDEGQSVLIAKDANEAQTLRDTYIRGEPENILSKLSNQPTLRTYTLSLIATELCNSEKELKEFFEDTLYAHQYGDVSEIHAQIRSILEKLEGWGMITQTQKDTTTGFVSANEYVAKTNSGVTATRLGRRVSELYLDPLTANTIIIRFTDTPEKITTFGALHGVIYTLEMRPYMRVRKKDQNLIEQTIIRRADEILGGTPDFYEDDYKEFLETIKTTKALYDWIHETEEDTLLEKYGVTPGELQGKKNRIDWVTYAATEILSLKDRGKALRTLRKLRKQIMHGVREELLPLVDFKGIGRVRARKLYNANIKTAGDIKKIGTSKLIGILGPKTAKSLKKQVGKKIEIKPEEKPGETTGTLFDYQ